MLINSIRSSAIINWLVVACINGYTPTEFERKLAIEICENYGIPIPEIIGREILEHEARNQ